MKRVCEVLVMVLGIVACYCVDTASAADCGSLDPAFVAADRRDFRGLRQQRSRVQKGKESPAPAVRAAGVKTPPRSVERAAPVERGAPVGDASRKPPRAGQAGGPDRARKCLRVLAALLRGQ